MPSTTPTTEPMPAERSGLLAEFARTCKAAARAVSLYPGAHPAIGGSLSRLVSASGRLTGDGSVVCSVHPDILAIDGQAPVRPDPAIGELASLLHERLIGELTIQHEADAEDWRALLLLLARAPEELIAEGGIGAAWAGSGRSHFEIREIDYAEVLRERAGGERAQWDRIIAMCLQGDTSGLDDRALQSLLDSLSEPERFGNLLEHFQNSESVETLSVSVRVAALLQLMRTALEAATNRNPADAERALHTMAASCARLTPEMMLALLGSRQSSNAAEAQMANALMERMSDRARSPPRSARPSGSPTRLRCSSPKPNARAASSNWRTTKRSRVSLATQKDSSNCGKAPRTCSRRTLTRRSSPTNTARS
jgi:hypothetical protein